MKYLLIGIEVLFIFQTILLIFRYYRYRSMSLQLGEFICCCTYKWYKIFNILGITILCFMLIYMVFHFDIQVSIVDIMILSLPLVWILFICLPVKLYKDGVLDLFGSIKWDSTVKIIQKKENVYKISWVGMPLRIKLPKDIDSSVLKGKSK